MTKHELPQKWPQAARGGRADAIYRGIFEAVVEHRLPPGAKLAEEQLGAIFGASRTIVRSALQDLAHDHIVTIERHRGAFVSAPTIADAHDVFFSRKVLESAIAREAAQRIKAADVARLRRMMEEESEALRRGDRQKAIRLSGDFHIAVAAICGEGRADAIPAQPHFALVAGDRPLRPRPGLRMRPRRARRLSRRAGGAATASGPQRR